MTVTFPTIARTVDFKSTKDKTYVVKENQFGDGYVQRTSDGLNAVRETWNNSWTNLLTAEKTTLETFFDGQGGWNPFFWTAPGDSSNKKWVARDVKIMMVDYGIWSVTDNL